jgi:hypothetical protein
MESTLAAEATVSPDGKSVSFIVLIRGLGVSCSITRSALEEHFWVPARADEAHLRKALSDGHHRISAAVERKWLKAHAEPINLNGSDFKF